MSRRNENIVRIDVQCSDRYLSVADTHLTIAGLTVPLAAGSLLRSLYQVEEDGDMCLEIAFHTDWQLRRARLHLRRIRSGGVMLALWVDAEPFAEAQLEEITLVQRQYATLLGALQKSTECVAMAA